MKRWFVLAMMVLACGTSLAAPPASAPPAAIPPIGPSQPVAPEVRDILQMLHDRKDTLKDFAGKIDYSVTDKTGDTTGKLGKVFFIMDPARGETFSAAFEKNTRDGAVVNDYRQDIIFDGVELTTKDYGMDGKGRLFTRSNMLPAGAKPGEAVSLNGRLPLPIGIPVDEVVRNFEASLVPSKEADRAVLRLVPRDKTKFDYSMLDVTVDKKQQLPIKLVTTSLDGSTVTTIKFEDLKINSGTVKLLDSSTPAKDGWKERS